MDPLLLLLLLIVLTPLAIRSYKKIIRTVAERSPVLLDYLDRANAPLLVRVVLRWAIGPFDWLAKQMNRETVVRTLDDDIKMDSPPAEEDP